MPHVLPPNMHIFSPAAFCAFLAAFASVHQQTRAFLNVFITPDEVMKLLGINAELYYVREGVINTYALNFVVMVPANITELKFSWQSLTKNPLPYSISVSYDTQDAVLPPIMNITSAGVIPTSVQSFSVKLLCTGSKSAETEVQLYLNVTSRNRIHNETSLRFRRNKICIKETKPPSDKVKDKRIILNPDSLTSTSVTLYIGAGFALTLIIMLITTASTICVRIKMKRMRMRPQEPRYTNAAYGSNQHVFVRLDSANDGRTPSAASGSYATIASVHKSPPSPSPYATSDALRVSYYASSQVLLLSQMALRDPRSCDPTDRLRALSLNRATISFDLITQDGTFGQIYRGKLRSQESVSIKTVTAVATKSQISGFVSEGTMMFGMMHSNILNIIGVNLDNPLKPLLVYPYVNMGNLKRFLMKCRYREEKKYTLSTQNLLDMAVEILLGLIYLHTQCICYKDLATRNCVVDSKLCVKITDNALSRDLFPNDYCCVGDQENRPIKWLALESLLNKQYSGASDVWSFGVVIWELITLGQQPYDDIDFYDIGIHLKNGHRLKQPTGCPDPLYAAMHCCWLLNPPERPNVVQLLTCLQNFQLALGKFV